MQNASFIHCKVRSYIFLSAGCTASFDNCFVHSPLKNGDTNSMYYFKNCVLQFTDGKIRYGNLSGEETYSTISNIGTQSILYNCVIHSPGNTAKASSTCYYNVANVDCFSTNSNTTNKVESDFTKLFKTWTGGDYTDVEKYDLTETAATTYLGDDGKQVGLYGGSLPYDPAPSHPKVTKFDVASKTTADGKLSVDIEVKAADY